MMRPPDDPTAAHARENADAANRAAALACIARLEADVNDARRALLRARVDLYRHRAALERIRADAKRGAGCAREPFARLVFGSLAIAADDALE